MLITLDEFVTRLRETRGDLSTVEDRIVLGDCLEALAHIPSCSIDLIHTSPPYNIDKAYKGEHGDKKVIERYLEFLRRVICELKRVLKPNGSLFWETGYTQIENGVAGDIYPIDMLTYPFFRDEPDRLVLWDRIIWRYLGGMAFKRKYTNRHETILWWVKPHEGQANPAFDVDRIREKSRELDKRNNLWGRNPGNVWEVDRVAFGSTEQSSHIAVYPEEISEKIIRASSDVHDLVLDPFSGSGTTPKVARSLGRKWIGIEISEEYAKESVRRIGFQQPNEVDSLLSALIKEKAFSGVPGALPIEEVAHRLVAWAKSTKLDASRQLFQARLAEVLETENSKSSKPQVWQEFDNRIAHIKNDPVVESDGFLARDYKNRKNLNGVMRYRTALEILEAVISLVLDTAKFERTIEQIAANEPSSYVLSNGVLTLQVIERRLKVLEGLGLGNAWLQAVFDLPPTESRGEPNTTDGEEGYQTRMFH